MSVAQLPVPGSAHPIVQAAGRVQRALDDVAEVSPVFMSADDKEQALHDLAAAESRLTELRLRVLASANDVAAASGEADAGRWYAHATHRTRREAGADLRLAEALDRRWTVVAAALRTAAASPAQARVITAALERLPATGEHALGAEILARAERTLVAHCSEFGPRDLARLGARILDHIAPEIAEAVQARHLAALEQTAHERTRLTLARRGDGTTRITGLLPDAAATRLATYLHAFTNPRRNQQQVADCDAPGAGGGGAGGAGAGGGGDPQPAGQLDVVDRLPFPRRLGLAFIELIETLDPKRLPLHGGDATTLIVTVPLASLQADLATAELQGALPIPGTGAGDNDGSLLSGIEQITADEARRLACTAGIIPAVLDGESVPLDLGRDQRLFTRA